MSKQKNKKSDSNVPKWLRVTLDTLFYFIGKHGLPNSVFVFFVAIFLFVANNEMRTEFFNKFILLNHTNQTPIYCIFTISFLIMCSLIIIVYQNKLLKQKSKEILRMGQVKSDLQSEISGKVLNSSK